MLDCPRCQVPLQSHTITTDAEGWEIEIDVCSDSCGGLWLEAHDFEADSKAKLFLDEELLALNKPRRKVNTDRELRCPECKAEMSRFDWNNEGIHLDFCPHCEGRWVDGGEIGRIQAQWNKEPLSSREEEALIGRVSAIKREEDERWQEQTFGQWLLDRVTLKGLRTQR
jgi:Zn-finger nucleic acid-binding protein